MVVEFFCSQLGFDLNEEKKEGRNGAFYSFCFVIMYKFYSFNFIFEKKKKKGTKRLITHF